MAAEQQRFVTLTRTGLTLAAALGLARVFPGASWFAPAVIAAILPACLFSLGDRLRWHGVWSAVAVAVAGVWLAILVDTPSETVLTLPTPAAWSTFASDLSNAPHVLRSAIVPVQPVGGAALVLAVVAVYVAAVATDIVGRRLDTPIGAIGPSIALYIALAALGSGRWGPTTACYGLAIVAYLVTLHAAEVSARRTWFRSRRAHRSQVFAGGLAAGAVVVALAIIVGPNVPGARGDPWLEYRKLGAGSGTSVLRPSSPLVSIRARLNEQSQEVVFTVSTSDGQPYKWRAVALDDLDAKGDWGITGQHGDQASTSALPKPTRAPGTHIVEQTYEIKPAADPYWLPAVYQPTNIDLKDAAMLPASTSLFLPPKHPVAGVFYKVDSEVLQPTHEQYERVTMSDLAPLADRTKLPAKFPARVRELARSLTASAVTPYDKAAALEDFFQSSAFTYDQTVNYATTTDALEQFIFTKRRGFCEQFATAFAVMARSVGLPTRVAVGYLSQRAPTQGHMFTVKGVDAHAWPEVWLGPQIGWTAFEPTKGRFDPTTQRGDRHAEGATTPTTNVAPTTTPTTTGQSINTPPAPGRDPKNIQVEPTGNGGSGGGTRPPIVAVILGVLVAALVGALVTLVVLIVAAWRRTHRRRFAPEPRGRVLGAWSEALERLRAAGVTPKPAATAIEFALRYAPAHGAGDAGPPLMDLARLQTAAMYAPDPPSASDADLAWKAVDDINDALRKTVTRTGRWRSRLRIRPRDRE
jgi:transglutaminase-like putative cysteine protease